MSQPEWIFTHDNFMKPFYRISPFSTTDITSNSQLPHSGAVDEWFSTRFPSHHPIWTMKARDGITLALEKLDLTSESMVTIITTSQNKYVSGCVTQSIEKVCKWNREISVETSALLLIHEFGKRIENSRDYYQLGLPIIEDFAHGFLERPPATCQADFIIYSFPKYFPIQYGGILLTKEPLYTDYQINANVRDYLKKVISNHIDHVEDYRQQRKKNHQYLSEKLCELDCLNRFEWLEDETPSAFIFTVPEHINVIELKVFMHKQGIESSVFYGERAFFIPLHHRLSCVDLDYFVAALRYFFTKPVISHEI